MVNRVLGAARRAWTPAPDALLGLSRSRPDYTPRGGLENAGWRGTRRKRSATYSRRERNGSGQATPVDEESPLYKCGWSPFSGLTFGARVTHTFINGHLVFADEEVRDRSRAMALEFDR